MDESPLVSIIIVNYNGKQNLEKCLQSLEKIDYQNNEIILVDNNSTDQSIEFVKKNHPNVIIIKLEKNYGFAKPNNFGAKRAHGKFLLFLNNDTVVSENFLTELVKAISSDPKLAICQSLLMTFDNKVDSAGDFIDNLGRPYRSSAKPKEQMNIFSARGASMLIKKDFFWDLEGFDEDFFVSFEDVDIGWRAWIWGYKVKLVPTSIVYHMGGQTTKRNNTEVQFHGVKNNLVLRLTNFEFSYSIKSIFMFFIINFFKKVFGYSLVKELEQSFELPSFKTIFKSIAWIFRNLNYIAKKRKLVNSRRIRSTRDLISLGLIKSPSQT